jgi:hypothetical protein
LTITPSTVETGQTFKVSGVLKDLSLMEQEGIYLKTITITADAPTTIEPVNTNSMGRYTATSYKDNSGTWAIQAHFAGDDLYKPKDSPIRTLVVTGPS